MAKMKSLLHSTLSLPLLWVSKVPEIELLHALTRSRWSEEPMLTLHVTQGRDLQRTTWLPATKEILLMKT